MLCKTFLQNIGYSDYKCNFQKILHQTLPFYLSTVENGVIDLASCEIAFLFSSSINEAVKIVTKKLVKYNHSYLKYAVDCAFST